MSMHTDRAPAGGRAEHRWVPRAVVVLSIAALAFEQSPANEAVRANLAFRALDHTGNAFVVGAVVFTITLVIEGVPGGLIAAGLHLNPGLLRRLMRRDRGGDDASASPRRGGIGSTLTDVGIALGVGAGLVVVRRRWADPRRTLRDDLRTGAWACMVVAVVSGLIGFLVAGGIRYADDVGLERPAELVVDYATDWKFWLVVVVLIQGGSWLSGRLRHRGSDPTQPETEAERVAERTEQRAVSTETRSRRDRPLYAAGRGPDP